MNTMNSSQSRPFDAVEDVHKDDFEYLLEFDDESLVLQDPLGAPGLSQEWVDVTVVEEFKRTTSFTFGSVATDHTIYKSK
mmetsp:Transcript_16107/g.21081  ORF Transcript_16107/g.21081 Transcript_16107/m.21081 type:complete len:80 (+) Transcript_16107:115-354(+)